MIETLFAFEGTTLLTFVVACIILHLTPGADMMFTVASGAAGGPRVGFAAAVGISFGLLVHVALAAAGLAAVIVTYPSAYDVIRWMGVIYLLFLAWQMWTSDPALEPVRGTAVVWRAVRRGFVTNILNPKVWLFVMAFLPQFTDPEIGPVWYQIVLLGLILAVSDILVSGTVGILAGWMRERIRRGAGLMNKLAALVFGGLAARLATT